MSAHRDFSDDIRAAHRMCAEQENLVSILKTTLRRHPDRATMAEWIREGADRDPDAARAAQYRLLADEVETPLSGQPGNPSEELREAA